jgi:hypothetical protein
LHTSPTIIAASGPCPLRPTEETKKAGEGNKTKEKESAKERARKKKRKYRIHTSGHTHN